MASKVYLIDLYAYTLKKGIPRFLVLKRAAEKIYAGQWRMKQSQRG